MMISLLVSLEWGPLLTLTFKSLCQSCNWYWDTDNGYFPVWQIPFFEKDWAGKAGKAGKSYVFHHTLLQNVWKSITFFMIFGWNSFFNFVATLSTHATKQLRWERTYSGCFSLDYGWLLADWISHVHFYHIVQKTDSCYELLSVPMNLVFKSTEKNFMIGDLKVS